MSQSVSSSGESQVYPYNVPYSKPADVAAKFGGTSTLFSTTSIPTTAQVQDVIVRKDSWINGWTGHDWLLHVTTEQADGVGSGRRAGAIYLRNWPVVSVDAVEYWQPGASGTNGAWIPGQEGFPDQTTGKVVGPQSVQPDAYYVYRKEAKIIWQKLRYDSRLRYRVRYTYGYPSVPDYIRDLSANLAAQETMMIFGGQFVPPSPERDYMTMFKMEEERLLTSITHRPLAAVS